MVSSPLAAPCPRLSRQRHSAPVLALAEAMTMTMTETMTESESETMTSAVGVRDQIQNNAAEQLPGKEMPLLLMAISAINIWNRLAGSTRQLLPNLSAGSRLTAPVSCGNNAATSQRSPP